MIDQVHDPNAVTDPQPAASRQSCQCGEDSRAYRDNDLVICTTCKLPVDYREAPEECQRCSRCGMLAAFRYDDYEQGWVSQCCCWPAKRLDPVETD